MSFLSLLLVKENNRLSSQTVVSFTVIFCSLYLTL